MHQMHFGKKGEIFNFFSIEVESNWICCFWMFALIHFVHPWSGYKAVTPVLEKDYCHWRPKCLQCSKVMMG